MIVGGQNSNLRRFQQEWREISGIQRGKRGRWVDQKCPNLAGASDRDSRLPRQIARKCPGIHDGRGVLNWLGILTRVLNLAIQTITPAEALQHWTRTEWELVGTEVSIHRVKAQTHNPLGKRSGRIAR